MERLTGVALPKDKGTCTKCPTEVRMSSSSHDGRWHCKIKLRRDYCDSTHKTLSESSEVEFATLEGAKGKRQLVHYIKAAQRALLNPGQPAEGYVDAARAEAGGAQDTAEVGFPECLRSQYLHTQGRPTVRKQTCLAVIQMPTCHFLAARTMFSQHAIIQPSQVKDSMVLR
jgi:hypothetical protein